MIIDWPDGSGDQITISPANGSGNAIMEMSSPANLTGFRRSVTVRLDGIYDNVRTEFVVYQEPTSQSVVTSLWLDDFPSEIPDSEVDWQIEHFLTYFEQNKYDYYDDITVDGQTVYLFKNNYFNDFPPSQKVPQYVVVGSINASDYVGKTIKDLGGSGRSGAVYPVLAVLDQDMNDYVNSSLLEEELQVVDFEYE